MSKKYSTRTCTSCGVRDIQPNMIQTTMEYRSGHSTTGLHGRTVALSLFSDKAAKKTWSYIAAPNKRVYTRRRKVWVCPSCYDEAERIAKENAKREKSNSIIAAIIMVPLILIAGIWLGIF